MTESTDEMAHLPVRDSPTLNGSGLYRKKQDQAKKAGKLSELIHFLRDNVDRVVSAGSTTNNKMA